MKIDVKTLAGEVGGDIELPEAIFGITEIRGDILQRCVTWQLAKRRAGTHKIQVRNEVSRTGSKMYKQKGTGGARHGSRRAAQFVGGAKAHGPVVRSHAFDLPKKVRALALRHALSSKAQAGNLIVLEDAALTDAKTAALRGHFADLGLSNALIIAGPAVETNFGLAARNIPNVDVLPDAGLNVYDVLRRHTLVLTRAAVMAINARFDIETAEAAPEAPAKKKAPAKKAAAAKKDAE
jgi:large subunit ribosomal protein L4